MQSKTIVQGRLDFGSKIAFDKALKMVLYRLDTYYKNEILFKILPLFNEEDNTIVVPRQILTNGTDKLYRSTLHLFQYTAQFAISGRIGMWISTGGKVSHHDFVEPEGDKETLNEFKKAEHYLSQVGKEKQALSVLDRVITLHPMHSAALTLRGEIKMKLGDYDSALADFAQSIRIDPGFGHAHFGRHFILTRQGHLDKAMEDLQETLRLSLALQSIQWKARRRKATLHIAKKEFAEAARELELFTKKAFTPADSNYQDRKEAYLSLARAYTGMSRYGDALACYEKALKIENEALPLSGEDYFHLAMMRKHVGQDPQADLIEAVRLGYEAAAEMIVPVDMQKAVKPKAKVVRKKKLPV
ncbi:MAG: tetratricopeptide repeat protein [Saprospiraceae bacterium]